MGLLNSFIKVLNDTWEDYKTPESFKVAEAFESYSRDVIFPEGLYKLIKKTHDYSQNKKDYVEESLLPDYQFQCSFTNKKFNIECKFRRTDDGSPDLYEICTAEQLQRYKKTNTECPTCILLGIAFGWKDFTIDKMKKYGTPHDFFRTEVNYFLLPVDHLNTGVVSESLLLDYSIAANYPVSPKRLWQFYEDKLDKGFCMRCKKEIQINYGQPLCPACFKEWNKYKNFIYKEKYCHACGKETEVSFAKPVCLSCYKTGK